MSRVIAIATSDIHLSHKAPVARSAEPDWYGAMSRSLRELRKLQGEYGCPLIIAGDIFDKWHANRTPELINFAIAEFSTFYQRIITIPGQHDLPEHRFEEWQKSAYGTLEWANSIEVMDESPHALDDLGEYTAHPFPWGREITPLGKRKSRVDVAVIHAYIWKQGFSYPGAPAESRVSAFRDRFAGYDVVVAGDNHSGFIHHSGDQTIFNCGTLMRRKIDEIDYKPQVGLIYDDGSVSPHYLDCSQDKFIEVDEETKDFLDEVDVDSMIEELKSLGADSLDFRDVINRRMNDKKVNDEVRGLILSSIES